jgi:dihydrofolate reductase
MIHNSKLSLIVAIDKNGGIGKNGKMPWNIPDDLARFRKITSGHPIVMGRKTYESIGRPLPGRTNIIITRDLGFKINDLRKGEDFVIVSSLKEAIEVASSMYYLLSKNKDKKNIPIHDTKYKLHTTENEIFVIGGGQIFEQAISIADKLYLTIVKGNFDADTFFPDYSNFTKKTFEESGESNGFKFTFVNLEK